MLKGDEEDLNVRGRHSTPFPVQLPAWLPREVVKEMVSIFEIFVLEELSVLGKNSLSTHSRKLSLQSQTGVSIGSDDSGSTVAIGFPG